jgi:hypothetical protein
MHHPWVLLGLIPLAGLGWWAIESLRQLKRWERNSAQISQEMEQIRVWLKDTYGDIPTLAELDDEGTR